MSEQNEADSQPLVGRLPTPTEELLIDYGKQLLLRSTDTAVDFHKTMLGISASFGTLIAALTPILIWGNKKASIPMAEGWILIIPLFLMLLSSVVFAWGYYPRYTTINVNVVDEIRDAREKIIKSRKLLGGIGLGLFSSSLLLTLAVSLYFRSNA